MYTTSEVCHFGGGRDKILTPATRYPLAATTPLTSSQHTDQHGLLRHTGNQRPWRGKSTKSLHFICSLAEQHNKKGRLLAVTLSLNNHTHKPKSNSSDKEILKSVFLFLLVRSQLTLTFPSHDAADCCGALCSLVAQARREQGGSTGRPIVHSARRWFGLARALLRVLQPPSSCCCCHPFCVHRSPATPAPWLSKLFLRLNW